MGAAGCNFQGDWGVTVSLGCGIGSGGPGPEMRRLLWVAGTARGPGGTHRTPGLPHPPQDSRLAGEETETGRPNHRKDDSQNTKVGVGMGNPEIGPRGSQAAPHWGLQLPWGYFKVLRFKLFIL